MGLCPREAYPKGNPTSFVTEGSAFGVPQAKPASRSVPTAGEKQKG